MFLHALKQAEEYYYYRFSIDLGYLENLELLGALIFTLEKSGNIADFL